MSLRSLLSFALICGCAGAAPPSERVEPRGAGGEEADAPESACVTTSETDGEWTRFSLCTPAPAWQGGPARAPWAEPLAPPGLAEGLARLVALGLADVRGGELRDVEIAVADVWGAVETRRVRAVVLPSEVAAPRFALVGPLVWVVQGMGPPLDVVAHCERALALSEQAETLERASRERWALQDQASAECPFGSAWPLLVDLGRSDLVQRAYGDVAVVVNDMVRENIVWALGALFERAVTQYMQRQDLIARADVELAIRLRALALSLGSEARALSYAQPLDQLQAELERRASRAPRLSVDVPSEGPVAIAMVPALIEALDEVDARQLGQPGGVGLAYDPSVAALVRAGEDAIPPLLECLEHDQRLTRSVHFWRDFSPYRTVLGVHEACYVALASILDADFFEVVATGDDLSGRGARGRERVATAVRTYWERWGRVTPLERRWQLLADDSASPEQWAEVAQWLVAEQSEPRESTIQIRFVDEDAPEPMQGEPLRESRGDALSTLLLARAQAAQAVGDDSSACALIDAVLEWTAPTPPAELTPSALVCVRDRGCECGAWVAAALGPHAPEVALAWLAGLELFHADYSSVESQTRALSMLLTVPVVATEIDRRLRAIRIDAARVRELTRSRPALVESTWILASQGSMGAVDLLDHALASRRRAATLELHREEPRPPDPDAPFVILSSPEPFPIVRHEPDGWWSIELPEPLEATRTLRACDFAARGLAEHLRVSFSLGWDSARRDAAITQIRAALGAMRREQERSAASAPAAD